MRKRTPWLEVPRPYNTLFARQHDAFDALLCALCARAALLGRTDAPPPQHQEAARIEGWAAVPVADSLDALAET